MIADDTVASTKLFRRSVHAVGAWVVMLVLAAGLLAACEENTRPTVSPVGNVAASPTSRSAAPTPVAPTISLAAPTAVATATGGSSDEPAGEKTEYSDPEAGLSAVLPGTEWQEPWPDLLRRPFELKGTWIVNYDERRIFFYYRDVARIPEDREQRRNYALELGRRVLGGQADAEAETEFAGYPAIRVEFNRGQVGVQSEVRQVYYVFVAHGTTYTVGAAAQLEDWDAGGREDVESILASVTIQAPLPSPIPEPTSSAPVELGELVTAKDVERYTSAPVDVTSVFEPTDTFYAVVKVISLPRGRRLAASWYFGPTLIYARYEIIAATDYNDTFFQFSLGPDPSQPWEPGEYKVRIAVDGKPDREAEFEVR